MDAIGQLARPVLSHKNRYFSATLEKFVSQVRNLWRSPLITNNLYKWHQVWRIPEVACKHSLWTGAFRSYGRYAKSRRITGEDRTWSRDLIKFSEEILLPRKLFGSRLDNKISLGDGPSKINGPGEFRLSRQGVLFGDQFVFNKKLQADPRGANSVATVRFGSTHKSSLDSMEREDGRNARAHHASANDHRVLNLSYSHTVILEC
jgi:hypothetical protein